MRVSFLLLLAVAMWIGGCEQGPPAPDEVVIYSSIDEPYLRPLMQRFEKQSGIAVRIVTDAEATKTAGLAERILAEKDRPQADVYWGNEIFHTLNLAQQGCFQPYRPAMAEDVPAKWRDADDLWTGIGVRARMIVLSARPEHAQLIEKITRLQDLADPALKGKVAVSHPAFGTASGHFAALYLLDGREKYAQWITALKDNDVKLLGGNSVVVSQVASGAILAGLTDSDDVNNAIAERQPVRGVLPDQDGPGTLLIPGTVALVKNCPHPDAAKKLIDFLCDPSVEKELIAGRYLAYSVRDTSEVKAMNVDYAKVAAEMKNAVELALTILQQR